MGDPALRHLVCPGGDGNRLETGKAHALKQRAEDPSNDDSISRSVDTVYVHLSSTPVEEEDRGRSQRLS